MAQHSNKGSRTQLNTLTAARKALTLDDLTTIRMMARFLETMIAEHPAEVVEHMFSSWMRATCIEAEEGTRKGSTTAQMLEFYSDMAEGLRQRITEAQNDA